jgi:hypothetical protein
MSVELVLHARQWIARELAANPVWDASSRLDESPPERDPRSLSWVVEDGDRMAQVVLWETGQSETDYADAGTGEVRTVSRNLAGAAEVEELLNSVSDWLRPA